MTEERDMIERNSEAHSEEEVFLSEASEVEEDAGTEGDYEFRGDTEESDDGELFENAVEQGTSLGSSPAGVDVTGLLARAAAAADAQVPAPQVPAPPRPAADAPAPQHQDGPLIDVAGIISQAVAAEDSTVPSAAEGSGSAPRGLPGLPSRPKPKGGLPSLPPRAGLGGGGLPPRQPSRPAGQAEQQEEAPAAAAPPSEARPAAAAAPTLPPRPAQQPQQDAAGAGAMFRRTQQQAGAAPALADEAPARPESAKVRRVKEKVQGYRTDMYRVALRLQYPTRSSVIQQLMYRLAMAERIHLNQPGTQSRNVEEQAQADAERKEVLGEPLNFSCSVLVLGLSGVGKTATIHSLLGKPLPEGYKETKKVSVIRGDVEGIPVTFIDTPGLEPSSSALAANLGKLHAAKRAFNKYRPEAVIYVDRLDVGRRDNADVQVARSITDVFGADIWFSAATVLTHALAPPPDSSSGAPLQQDMYLQQRQQQVQSMLRQVAGDQRLMNPVALAENAPSCPRNERGEPVLPSGQEWRRTLLMLCFTTKVLTDSNNVLKPGDSPAARQPTNPYAAMMAGMKVPPIGWLLARLIDFKSPRKYPEDEREIKFDDEIEKLPPNERNAQIRKKRAFIRQRAEESRAGDVPTPVFAPSPELPPSFDPEVGDYKYRVLDDASGLLTRPVIGGEGGVDHDDGIDTLAIEKSSVVRKKGRFLGGVPAVGWIQIQKDKNQLAFQGEVEGSTYHSSKWVSTSGVNVQAVGRDILYTWRTESRYKTSRRNKATIGSVVGKLGEDYSHPFKGGSVAYGVKVDDRFKLANNMKLRGSLGRMWVKMGGSYDQATGLAADLKIKPSFDESMRILAGTNVIVQRRDTTIAGNLSTEFRLPKRGSIGAKSDTTVSGNVQYNNKGSGTIVLRVNSHDYPLLAASMALPVLRATFDKVMDLLGRGGQEF